MTLGSPAARVDAIIFLAADLSPEIPQHPRTALEARVKQTLDIANCTDAMNKVTQCPPLTRDVAIKGNKHVLTCQPE